MRYSEMCVKLCEEFGPVSNWPFIAPKKPGFLRLKQRKLEQRVCDVLSLPEITQLMRSKFWTQIYAGQGYTDATGYKLRCWRAMLDIPFLPADISFSAIRHDPELLAGYGFLEDE